MNSKIEAITKTINFCHKNLLKDDETMDYLVNKRKMSVEHIKRFKFGLFPRDLRKLFEVVNPRDLRAAELIKHASKSMFRMWDLIIPIYNAYDDAIAISGRTRLAEEERKEKNIPKYVNSRYDKSHHLFGLNWAKKSIIEKDCVYVVEGYFDVISPHVYGFTNVVATCGSFLSTRHLALLSRYTKNIILMFDNEPAAQERAHKTIQKKDRSGLNLSVLNPLPSEIKDLDQFLTTYNVEKLYNLINCSSHKVINENNYNNIKPLW